MGYEIHPAAAIFPMMDDAELLALADDIKKNGQRERIARLGQDGPVIDGRNRLRACEIAGATPRFRVVHDIGDPIDFVLSLNLHRRQLSVSQRSMVAEQVATMRVGRPPENTSKEAITMGTSITQAAAALGVSKPTVERARSVRKHAPDLVPAIESGDMTVGAAVREIKRRSGSDVIAATSRSWADDQARKKKFGMGEVTARQAVRLLESIKPRDPDRESGLRIVHEWLTTQGVCNGK